MDLNYCGKWIRVQSYKHDGSLHRTWDNAMIIEYNEDYIAIASLKTKVTESDGRRWYTKEPAVSVFFFKEWFNVIAMIREDSIYYYTNIASPSLIDDSIIKYIDYDLDFKLLPTGEIVHLDEKEYLFHKSKYGYSDELDKVINFVNDKVKTKIIKREFPFDNFKILEIYKQFLSLKELQDHDILH